MFAMPRMGLRVGLRKRGLGRAERNADEVSATYDGAALSQFLPWYVKYHHGDHIAPFLQVDTVPGGYGQAVLSLSKAVSTLLLPDSRKSTVSPPAPDWKTRVLTLNGCTFVG